MKQKRTMFLILATAAIALVFNAKLWAADGNANDSQVTVWTMSNDTAGNSVLAFRLADDTLTPLGSVPTGGTGSGGREPDLGLGNAHAIQLSEDGRLMFVVNPGSNDISVLAVTRNSLTLLDRVPSGGQQPVSITVHGDLVYVVNAGGNVGDVDNITGFRLNGDGTLTQISNSTRPLSTAATAPAQIEFSPDGALLVVTEKNTNIIDTFTVGAEGRATGPTVIQADAITPFGFEFHSNRLFIADDFNDAIGLGAMSSYTVAADGSLHLVSSDIASHESGGCWVATDGHFAFLSNTVSSTISTYAINQPDGSLSFLRSFPGQTAPSDLALSHDGQFLFALLPDQRLKDTPRIRVWRVNPSDGSVTQLQGVANLPRSVNGLVAR